MRVGPDSAGPLRDVPGTHWERAGGDELSFNAQKPFASLGESPRELTTAHKSLPTAKAHCHHDILLLCRACFDSASAAVALLWLGRSLRFSMRLFECLSRGERALVRLPLAAVIVLRMLAKISSST